MKTRQWKDEPQRRCADCGTSCWGTRCRRCFLVANPSRPPRVESWGERKRRKATVDAHRAAVGNVCPGYQVPAHAVIPPNRLTADHVTPVAAGGREDGDLAVLCQSCNSRKREGRPASGQRPVPAPSREWFPRSQEW